MAISLHEFLNPTVGGLQVFFDGGGSTLIAGSICRLGPMPYAGIFTSVTLLGDLTGSLMLDVTKITYSSYGTVSASSICGTNKPTITSSIKSRDTTLSTWTQDFVVDDVFIISVVSCSNITQALMTLKATRK